MEPTHDEGDERVTRTTTLPVPVAEVWDAVADPDQLRCWLAPEVDLDLQPGGRGRVVDDDGVERRVVVDEVAPGERLALRWWPAGQPADVSRVELVLTPLGDPAIATTVVTVTETRLLTGPAAQARASACASAARWTGALLALGFTCRRARV